MWQPRQSINVSGLQQLYKYHPPAYSWTRWHFPLEHTLQSLILVALTLSLLFNIGNLFSSYLPPLLQPLGPPSKSRSKHSICHMWHLGAILQKTTVTSPRESPNSGQWKSDAEGLCCWAASNICFGSVAFRDEMSMGSVTRGQEILIDCDYQGKPSRW